MFGVKCRSKMEQKIRWLTRFEEVMDFIEKEHRKPSKYYPEEKLKFHWIHQNKKLLNAEGLKDDRIELFKRLLEMYEENRHVNQYV